MLVNIRKDKSNYSRDKEVPKPRPCLIHLKNKKN
jgi:hypothetical protein